MSLPPLYKFLNPEGAMLTLGNGTFRHAKPADFEDDMDMTIESMFPECIEVAAEQMTSGVARMIFENLDREPTSQNARHRAMVSEMQEVFRTNPDAVDVIERELQDDHADDIYDIRRLKAVTKETIDELNELLQNYRVLCVTDDKASHRMWESYAANHAGVVIRITPNEAKDSKFKLFQKVNYVRTRPTLYESTKQFKVDSLFGDPFEKTKMILNKIIYTKTSEFEFEREYRLAIPLGPYEEYNTLTYHPEEISELYLGSQITEVIKTDVITLARNRNPNIEIFQSSVDDHGEIVFHQL